MFLSSQEASGSKRHTSTMDNSSKLLLPKVSSGVGANESQTAADSAKTTRGPLSAWWRQREVPKRTRKARRNQAASAPPCEPVGTLADPFRRVRANGPVVGSLQLQTILFHDERDAVKGAFHRAAGATDGAEGGSGLQMPRSGAKAGSALSSATAGEPGPTGVASTFRRIEPKAAAQRISFQDETAALQQAYGVARQNTASQKETRAVADAYGGAQEPPRQAEAETSTGQTQPVETRSPVMGPGDERLASKGARSTFRRIEPKDSVKDRPQAGGILIPPWRISFQEEKRVVEHPYGVLQQSVSQQGVFFPDETRVLAEPHGKARLSSQLHAGAGSRGTVVEGALPLTEPRPSESAAAGAKSGGRARGRPRTRMTADRPLRGAAEYTSRAIRPKVPVLADTSGASGRFVDAGGGLRPMSLCATASAQLGGATASAEPVSSPLRGAEMTTSPGAPARVVVAPHIPRCIRAKEREQSGARLAGGAAGAEPSGARPPSTALGTTQLSSMGSAAGGPLGRSSESFLKFKVTKRSVGGAATGKKRAGSHGGNSGSALEERARKRPQYDPRPILPREPAAVGTVVHVLSTGGVRVQRRSDLVAEPAMPPEDVNSPREVLSGQGAGRALENAAQRRILPSRAASRGAVANAVSLAPQVQEHGAHRVHDKRPAGVQQEACPDSRPRAEDGGGASA
ncbi:hypothetical protein Purlil1_13887 [Purpureocillium lilacinum]|uniref:Uncharacterized protein n=1 Tax=Purpureocillium lilacinum TaxID=33203 RepID=A0ABR0BCX6_PURLI|nr:hypothetical protein Purlil1_13887 [Purpureocillium lilacinum]